MKSRTESLTMTAIVDLGVTGTLYTFNSFQSKVRKMIYKKPYVVVYEFKHHGNVKIKTYTLKNRSLTENKQIIGTMSEYFITLLPSNRFFDLYLFTDGKINALEFQKCRSIIQKKNMRFSKVYLYYIGDEQKMDLRYMNLFEGDYQKLFINNRYIGTVNPLSPNLINLHYMMKNDTFKLTILNEINSSIMNKALFTGLSSRIYKEYFEDKLTIRNFYENNDVVGCILYVKRHSHNFTKVDFWNKMFDIEKLFYECTDTCSLENVKRVKPYSLKDYEDRLLDHEEESLECEYQTHSILNQRNKLACIPVKLHQNKECSEIQNLKNPFQLLESNKFIKEITEMVGPYTKDYLKSDCLQNFSTNSPDNDKLERVYIIFSQSTICINEQDVIRHNNYVLSELFQNDLPGKSIIWHMIFLYILAMEKCKDIQNILFEEIKMLGGCTTHFISLKPELKPCIVEELNVCFWYLAHVCHIVFPNDKRNVLRNADFISGMFLKFYRDVYENDYTYPNDFLLWKLWYAFCIKDSAIFSILTHYYSYRLVESESQIILYRRELKHVEKEPLKEFEFVSPLRLQTVLNVYKKFLKQKKINFYEDVKVSKLNEISLYTPGDDTQLDLMFHVRINIMTCNPFVICPITSKHWKDCIQPYDKHKYSYIKMFRKYCVKYQRYPKCSEDLMSFLNEYMFKIKNRIPELFPVTFDQQMDNVLKIFRNVMETYSCTEYLKCSNDRSAEDLRLRFE